jgi:hypothetical protein
MARLVAKEHQTMEPSVPPVPPPPTPASPFEQIRDVEHLRVLSICHYVLAGLAAMGGCVPILHLGMGIAMVNEAFGSGRQAPPAFLGWIFIAVAGVLMVALWIMAILLFLAARNLALHRRPTFCFVVACICCLQVPLGTILGVFTILVLSRPSVKALFEPSDRPLGSAPIEG